MPLNELEIQTKPLPQDVELEKAVLGALMLEKDSIIEISDVLKVESFHFESHQHIYKAIQTLSKALQPIDTLTVAHQLTKDKTLETIGGAAYLMELVNKVPSSAHLYFHARIIAQKYIQRELIRVSNEILNKSYDESNDIEDLINFSEREIFNIAQGNVKKDVVEIKRIIDEAINQIKEASLKEGMSGAPSGYTEIDRITSGWQKTDLVIIAARPSMGKTAFILSMARNMAVDHNVAVAVFSLEMASVQLVTRLIVAETGIQNEDIKRGKLRPDQWTQISTQTIALAESPMYIDDTPSLSIFEFRSKARRLKQTKDIGCIIVDYLQLMTAGEKAGSREQEVSLISRSLKAIAKELDVPIIALSQLNRGLENRGQDKKPQLSDLRESGAIEQDADMVLMIHRPERYGVTQDTEGNSLIGLAQIVIAKHRNGAVGDVWLKFQANGAKFCDLDPETNSRLNGHWGKSAHEEFNYVSRFNDNSSTQFLDGSIPENNSFEKVVDDGAPF